MASTDSARGIKTTSRVFQIIELLMERDGMQLTEVAKELDMAKSTAYRHLVSIEREGYVVREGDVYYPGMKFLNVSQYVRTRKDVYELTKPKVEQLADRTDERAEFIIEEQGWGIFVHRAIGDNAVQTDTQIGKRVPLHATAAGKAILADYPDEQVEVILDQRGLSAMTDQTITGRDELYAELEEIRDDSVAYNRQEYIEGLNAVGVPVANQDDEVLGALSISGPSGRLKGEALQTEFPDLLRGVANELELNIAYS